MHRAYYGCSGLRFGKQLLAIANYAAGKTERRLMLGTNMSSGSLRGRPGKRPKLMLQPDDARGIYRDLLCDYEEDDLFPVIHFNSEGPNVIDAELALVDRIIHSPSGGGELVTPLRLLKGFQINAALPDAGYLRWFQANHLWSKRYEIILQLGQLAFSDASYNPTKLADIVKRYKDAIDYVQIDILNGGAKRLDPEWARPYLQALTGMCPWVGLAVAGGIGPDTLDIVAPLADEFPFLSVNVEGKVRDSNDNLVVELFLRTLDGLINIFEKRRDKIRR